MSVDGDQDFMFLTQVCVNAVVTICVQYIV